MSPRLINHVLQARADKRCKGDCGSRRDVLAWRPWDYRSVQCSYWENEYISIQRAASSGVTELLERFRGETTDWNSSQTARDCV